MRTARYLPVLALAVAAAFGSAAWGGSRNEQLLRTLDAQWSKAAGEKDAARTAAFYAEDGVLLPFGAPLVSGRAKIQEAWAALMAKPGFALHFEPKQIVVAKSGDMAYDVGTFELTLNDAQGKPSVIVGKFLVAWAKQKNGQWKAAADCFNTDQ